MIEVRTFSLALEAREDGRTLVGVAVPYGVEAQIGRFTETFRRGAFAGVDPEQVPLLAQHDREQLPIGRALSFTDTDRGLEAELRVSKTALGDDVLELVRDGAARGLSVGFLPVEDVWNTDRTRVERARADLKEISITAWPAYAGAEIVAVRSDLLTEVSNPRPRLQLARRR